MLPIAPPTTNSLSAPSLASEIVVASFPGAGVKKAAMPHAHSKFSPIITIVDFISDLDFRWVRYTRKAEQSRRARPLNMNPTPPPLSNKFKAFLSLVHQDVCNYGGAGRHRREHATARSILARCGISAATKNPLQARPAPSVTPQICPRPKLTALIPCNAPAAGAQSRDELFPVAHRLQL